MNPSFKKAFVCGWPIAHSRSPQIHQFWLKQFQISGSYEKIAVKPEDFVNFLQTIKADGYCGGNVTIPHKETALACVSRTDDAATKIGAVNTLWLEEGEWVGGNTDWLGFTANLDECAPGWDKPEKLERPAVILGAGGAARGIVYALVMRGFKDIVLVNRTIEAAQRLALDFSLPSPVVSLSDLDQVSGDLSLLINTTSLGMDGKQPLPDSVVRLIGRVSKKTIASDIVYIPLETEFLAKARHAGLVSVDGLGMLLHQAVPGFQQWFGVKPEVTSKLRNLVISGIEGHK